jgi:hypothetical protein
MHGRTIVITRSGWAAAHSWQIRSDSVLSRAYANDGTPRTGSSSVSGTGLSGKAPYAVEDEATSTCPVPAAAAASSTLWVPFTSTSYMKCSSWDGLRMKARWIRASAPERSKTARTASRSRTSTRSNDVLGR